MRPVEFEGHDDARAAGLIPRVGLDGPRDHVGQLVEPRARRRDRHGRNPSAAQFGIRRPLGHQVAHVVHPSCAQRLGALGRRDEQNIAVDHCLQSQRFQDQRQQRASGNVLDGQADGLSDIDPQCLDRALVPNHRHADHIRGVVEHVGQRGLDEFAVYLPPQGRTDVCGGRNIALGSNIRFGGRRRFGNRRLGRCRRGRRNGCDGHGGLTAHGRNSRPPVGTWRGGAQGSRAGDWSRRNGRNRLLGQGADRAGDCRNDHQ